MASTKAVKRTPSGRVSYRGETFAGYNKPKRTSGGSKKFAVLAKKGDDVKLVRFGDPNMTIKKPYQSVEPTLGLVTTVTLLKINFQHDTGAVKNGS